MAVESNYAIAIATLGDWPKNLAPVLQPTRSNTKTNRTLNAWFFPRLEQFSGNDEEFWLVQRAFCPLWLVRAITLVLFFWQSFKNWSIQVMLTFIWSSHPRDLLVSLALYSLLFKFSPSNNRVWSNALDCTLFHTCHITSTAMDTLKITKFPALIS